MDCFKDLIPEEGLITEEAPVQSRSPLHTSDGDENAITTGPLLDVEATSSVDTFNHVNMSNWFDGLDEDDFNCIELTSYQ